MTKQIDGIGRTTEYVYNLAGQVKEIIDAKKQKTVFEYDAMGRVLTKTDPLGGITSYVYDNRNGNLRTITDPWGRITKYGFDMLRRLETVIDPENHTTIYQYDAAGKTTHIMREGQVTEYQYDTAGRLEKSIDPGNGVTEYAYYENGQMKEVKNPLGQITKFEYDPLSRLVKQTNALGHSVSIVYDELGRVKSQIDPRGFVTQFKYDEAARSTEVIHSRQKAGESQLTETSVPANGEKGTVYKYDEGGRLSAIRDTRGNTTRFEYDEANELRYLYDAYNEKSEYRYDELGRLTHKIDPLGQVSETRYDALGRVVAEINKAGDATRYEYDPAGVYVDMIDPQDGRTRLEFDKIGLLTKQTDAMNGVTLFDYDKLGRLVKQTNQRGHSAEFDYDALGNLKKIVDPKGGTTAFVYDAIGRMQQKTSPLGQVWKFSYDDGNRLIEQTDPMLNISTFNYDEANNLTGYTDPMLRSGSFDYDHRNRLIKSTDPKGFSKSFEYDDEGNLVKEINELGDAFQTVYDKLNRSIKTIDAEGGVKEVVYDKIGRVINTIDGKGNKTEFAYDPMNRLKLVTDAKQGRTQYQYDKLGNLLDQIDANGHTTSWRYDKLSRVTSEIDPLGNTTSFDYDGTGNLTKRIDANDQLTTFRYDENQQLTDVLYGTGGYKHLEYDAAGRLTRAANAAADESFGYDMLDQLVSIRNTTLGKSYGFQYDKVGNRTHITDPDGRITAYEYDVRNQITKLTDPDGFITSYSYTPTGTVDEQHGGDQTVTKYAYDKNGRTKLIKTQSPTGLLSSFAYSYDKNGNILTQIEEDVAVTSYEYDELNRLVAANYPKAKIEQIRNTYYTPPLNKLFPGGQDGTGNTDETTPTVPGGPDSNGKKGDNGDKLAANSNLLPVPDPLKASPQETDAVKSGNGGGNGGNSQVTPPTEGNNGNGNGKGPKDDGGLGGEEDDPQVYPEVPDYLLKPSARVTYTYDAVGNRTSRTDDYEKLTYTYDPADRLISTNKESFQYDKSGNMVERHTENGIVKYRYTPENQLEEVKYPDDTYVKFEYDAFDRKVFREEQYYDLNGPAASMGNGKGYGRDNNPGQGNGYGKDNNPTPGSNGNGGKGKGKGGGLGNGHAYGRKDGISNYQLKKEQTRYLYDDNSNLLNEYTGEGDSLAQYYHANGEVVARKMFGFKGRKDQRYLGNLRDRGHLLFYHYDQNGNVTDLTDHLGSEVMKYRYDAFGGLFTSEWAPYNSQGLTGKSYDAKASLMDYAARWYSPDTGRFTSRDSWTGDATLPQTLNRYVYVLNNPGKYIDPNGHRPTCGAYDALDDSECSSGDSNPLPTPEDVYQEILENGDTALSVEELRAIAEAEFNRRAGRTGIEKPDFGNMTREQALNYLLKMALLDRLPLEPMHEAHNGDIRLDPDLLDQIIPDDATTEDIIATIKRQEGANEDREQGNGNLPRGDIPRIIARALDGYTPGDVLSQNKGGINVGNKGSGKGSSSSGGGGKGASSSIKSVNDILSDATPGRATKGKTTQYEKTGGFEQANKEFDSLNPSNVKDIETKYGPGKTGTLPDGRTITVRPGSTDGRPTIEIRYSNGRGIEIRYGE